MSGKKVWWGVACMTAVLTGAVVFGYVKFVDQETRVSAAAAEVRPQQVGMLDPFQGPDTLEAQQVQWREEIRLERERKHREYLEMLKTAPGQEIASFSTSLYGRDAEGRVQNIVLANNKINGTILLPGEGLSFNEATGDSNDPNAGWKLATVIVGKEFAQGYGGGICQVSTTLYNSVKNAGLKITERHTHTLPVGYIEPGRDATVSYPELDFKFVNSLKHPVKVMTYNEGGQVVSKILALPPEE